MKRFLPSLQIIGITIAACMVYGLVHALAATQISIIYYAAFYPFPPVLLENPVLFGLVLGVATSWWLGLSLGVILALACRKGDKPKLGWKSLVKPLLVFVGIALVCTAIVGGIAYVLSIKGMLELPDAIWHLIMYEEEAGFWAVGFMNLTAYLAAMVGCIWMVLRIRSTRKRLSENPSL